VTGEERGRTGMKGRRKEGRGGEER